MNFKNAIENALFAKAKEKNPSLTEEEFSAKREDALSRANAGDHKLVEGAGILMEELPKGDELKELTEDQRDIAGA